MSEIEHSVLLKCRPTALSTSLILTDWECLTSLSETLLSFTNIQLTNYIARVAINDIYGSVRKTLSDNVIRFKPPSEKSSQP